MLVVAYCDLGLRARLAMKSPSSHRPAITAGTIPLRKAATCGRTESFDVHGLHCSASVGIDLAIQRDFLEFRRAPPHSPHLQNAAG